MKEHQVTKLISPEYKRIIQVATEKEPKWGNGGKHHVDEVMMLAHATQARSILDYGCGTGSFKKVMHERGLMYDIREYDPARPGKDAEPMFADLVVCTDVLEHVEPEYVAKTLATIRQLSLKGGFLIIATSKASFILPDGRNAHLTIMPPDWWEQQLLKHGFKITNIVRKKGMRVTYQ